MAPPQDIVRMVRHLIARMEYAPAEDQLREALGGMPKDAELHNLMCFVLAHTGRTEEALSHARRSAELQPDRPHILTNLGSALMNLGRYDEAVEVLTRAVGLERVGMVARHALALTLINAKRFSEAEQVAREGLDRAIMDPVMSVDLANAQLCIARADLAVKTLRAMLSWYPDEPHAIGNMATMLNYVPGADPMELRRAHDRYADMLGMFLPAPNPPRITDPRPERGLRIGMFIPDLISHPVAGFMRPVLERLDTERFELFVYYTSPADRVEAPWRMAAHTARRVQWHTEMQLDPLLRGDRLDILIDLCGMTVHHRLPSMYLKPAPIQVTYAGYPNTTGIGAIDFRIVDSLTDPPGTERFSSEELVRLDPCFLCFVPPEGGGDPGRVPGGPITFASFNHLPKINEPLIRMWAGILAEVPGSRLLIKADALSHRRTRDALRERFVAAGIETSRLDIRPPTPTRAEHLAMYNEVDVALDTFPYHGTTTTCEAMFMGVPVVSFAGKTHVSRVGVSLLTNAGLPELLAKSEVDYIRLAVELARDADRRAGLRRTLRGSLLSSPLCDAAAFAARFQGALRAMWLRACAGS